MVLNIVSLILKFFSLGFVIIAAGLWASGGVEIRPKDRDEQTLIGGAVWSQTQIPLGLIITMIVDEKLDIFVHAYFLFAGLFILAATGIMLVTVEGMKLKKKNTQATGSISNISRSIRSRDSFDKTYFIIGILLMSAAAFTLADLITNLI